MSDALFGFKYSIFQGLQSICLSFPLYGRGGLSCDVVDDAADAFDLVGDARGDAAEELVAQWRVFAGHEVRGAHGAQGEDIAVIAEVTVEHLSAEMLDHLAQRITSEVPGINRVLFDYTPKPPATVEYE